jgi:hypothetical protein
MTRDLGAGLQTKLQASTRRVVDLVLIKNADGGLLTLLLSSGFTMPLNFTNCDVDLMYDSISYEANRGYIQHSSIQESSKLTNDKLDIVFTGVDLENAQAILNSNYIGAVVQIRKVVIGADYTFSNDDVYLVYEGFINTFQLQYNRTDASLVLSVGGPFAAFERSTIYGYTSVSSHSLKFADDLGMSFSQKTLSDIKWGIA